MRWPSPKQKTLTFTKLKYDPFPAQADVHQSTATALQIVGAEGAGKSFVTAAEVIACVPWCKLVYLVGETFENPRPEFNYIADALERLGAVDPAKVSRPKQGPWGMVTQTGCRIVTLSALRGGTAVIARGEQPDIIVLCEAGVISSFGVATAAIRRVTRSKGRVILTGTLKDDYGWYASLVDEFQVQGNAWRGESYSLPAWTNLQLYPGGEADPEIQRLKEILPADEFARTIEAKRMPSKDLVFPEFNFTVHVRPCPFDPNLPVTIWIDPGYYPSAYVVLAVQFHGDEVWIIDEIYVNFHRHDQVIELCSARPWWRAVQAGVIDYAGRQHHAEKSAIEVWRAKTGLYLRSKAVGVLDGIARHRTFLAPRPRLFHDPKTKYTQGEYKLYRRPSDKDGNATSDIPKDKDNHAMKAIAYGLVDKYGVVDTLQEIQSAVVPNEKLREGLERGGWS